MCCGTSTTRGAVVSWWLSCPQSRGPGGQLGSPLQCPLTAESAGVPPPGKGWRTPGRPGQWLSRCCVLCSALSLTSSLIVGLGIWGLIMNYLKVFFEIIRKLLGPDHDRWNSLGYTEGCPLVWGPHACERGSTLLKIPGLLRGRVWLNADEVYEIRMQRGCCTLSGRRVWKE